jgi:5-methyltetrahydropteroyltriglutamate--homocysteine methyltransferase
MRHSEDRILTTHTGSLPRAAELTALLVKREAGEPYDETALEQQIRGAVDHVVGKQIACGVDVGNDGEQPRVGFQTYVPQRMSGFGGESQRPAAADMLAFPKSLERVMGTRGQGRPMGKIRNAPQAIAEVSYQDLSDVEFECDVYDAALAKQTEGFTEGFMTAASPGIIATTMLNAHYASHEAYVTALAREMKKEYRFIVEHGYVLQIDAPDLAMERTIYFQDKSLGEFLEIAEMHVAALNTALEGIPRDRVRLHCCWGHWNGPHTHDVELESILPVLYRANVGAINVGFGNPRHAHEIPVLENHPLPDSMIVIAGTIDTTTSYVEHPELVAQRIERVVQAVGDRHRVMAGTDCGFATFAGYEFVTEDVVWAKLASLGEGAKIASTRLWG